ncbi:MAG: SDR family oxidoreductase [Magnetococcales bacterium]|nr:SDR family oxidoreductase [Magnetococcales bacterium]
MDMGLSGVRVLVTGSSRGIGFGIAEAFLQEKASVILTGRSEATIKKAYLELAKRYGSEFVDMFVGDLGDSTVRVALKNHLSNGGVDHIVCNVGSGTSMPVLQETTDEWRRMFDINLYNTVGVVQDLRELLAQSASEGRDASLTLVGSICGMEALGCPLAYASAKAALWAYAKNLVKPLAKYGIRVNQLSPGNIIFPGSTWATKMAQDAEGVQSMLNREVAMQRLGTLAEVAKAVVFLSSSSASFITGTNLVVDGGQIKGV